MRVLDCGAADFLDQTRRVMGTLSGREAEALRAHAEDCPRRDWGHALDTGLWGLVERERERRALRVSG